MIFEFLLMTIACILYLYILISIPIYFFALYKNRDLDQDPLFNIELFNHYAVSVGCLFGLSVLFIQGFQEILFFIPDTIGSVDENGDWQSVRSSLSYILGPLLSLLILYTTSSSKKNTTIK